MGDGIRVEVQVTDLEQCPVAIASKRTDRPITTVSWSESDVTGTVVEEFTTASDATPLEVDGIEEVFDANCCTRHRFSRQEVDCVCQLIERVGSPIEGIRLVDGNLTVSFYVLDTEEVRDIVSTLREQFPGVTLQRLQRADCADDGAVTGGDLVWVDRESLTDRQQEVLETAHEMGYFEYPRKTNATEVAETIGIAPSTFSEHLTVAQSKILGSLLAEDESTN